MNNRKTSQGFANVSIKILKYVVMVVIIVIMLMINTPYAELGDQRPP